MYAELFIYNIDVYQCNIDVSPALSNSRTCSTVEFFWFLDNLCGL